MSCALEQILYSAGLSWCVLSLGMLYLKSSQNPIMHERKTNLLAQAAESLNHNNLHNIYMSANFFHKSLNQFNIFWNISITKDVK